jgi:hypothetical protein
VTLRELNRATLARQMLLARQTVTSVKAIERLAGQWKIERKKKPVTLALDPFDAIPKKTLAALEQEGEALRRFTDEDTHDRNVRRARP